MLPLSKTIIYQQGIIFSYSETTRKYINLHRMNIYPFGDKPVSTLAVGELFTVIFHA